MGEIYTTRWIEKNGSIASDMWLDALATLTPDQIALGISKCKEKLFSGDKWPPDLGEFLAMIHGHSSLDFHGAFMRCLDRKPEGRIEQWVYDKIGYNVRVSSHEQAERLHKKQMLEAIEKDRRGELVLDSEMLKALPPNSVKNKNDLCREEYEQRNGKALHPRIAKILGK